MFTPDPVLKGLYTKQLSTGSVWVLKAKLRGTRRNVTVTIGRTDVFSPAQARTEARTMLWQDVDFDNKTMTVRETKNGKPLTLPLPDAIGRILKRRLESSSSPFVFSNADGTSPASLKHTVERVFAETGIKFCLHDLRPTVATVAFNKGGFNLDQIAALLNHSKGDVTEGYVQWTLDTVRPIMQAVEDDLLQPYMDDTDPPEPTEADHAALGLPAKERPARSNVLPFRAGRQRRQG